MLIINYNYHVLQIEAYDKQCNTNALQNDAIICIALFQFTYGEQCNFNAMPMHCTSLLMISRASMLHCTTMLITSNLIPKHCRTICFAFQCIVHTSIAQPCLSYAI